MKQLSDLAPVVYRSSWGGKSLELAYFIFAPSWREVPHHTSKAGIKLWILPILKSEHCNGILLSDQFPARKSFSHMSSNYGSAKRIARESLLPIFSSPQTLTQIFLDTTGSTHSGDICASGKRLIRIGTPTSSS